MPSRKKKTELVINQDTDDIVPVPKKKRVYRKRAKKQAPVDLPPPSTTPGLPEEDRPEEPKVMRRVVREPVKRYDPREGLSKPGQSGLADFVWDQRYAKY
jgi:hypothetical protein